MLYAHGATVELGKKWAESLLLRMGLVNCKATKVARKVPLDFADIKLAFLQVAAIAQEKGMPPELIINWDQTGAKFVPTSNGHLQNRV